MCFFWKFKSCPKSRDFLSYLIFISAMCYLFFEPRIASVEYTHRIRSTIYRKKTTKRRKGKFRDWFLCFMFFYYYFLFWINALYVYFLLCFFPRSLPLPQQSDIGYFCFPKKERQVKKRVNILKICLFL